MRCILMNKNKEIALIELNSHTNSIEKIYEIYNLEYSPLYLKIAVNDKSINNAQALNMWFRGRGIPAWRKDLESLLEKLNITSPDELLNKSYALSLSDQYWIKDEKQKDLKWEDINFFTNDFKYKGYFNISLSSSGLANDIDLHSPNNTTDGMLQKAWIIENTDRVLVKGTYFPARQEPLNEWLVSRICEKLNIDYCNYEIDIIDNKIVSKCKDFITENEEIITAYEIFYSEKRSNSINDFEHYIGILEKNGIKNARQQVENMFLIDYIVMNIDRHMKNFGIIRNVETLKWERTTPIFDTGECLQCDKLTNEMNFNDGKCKFFSNTNKSISELLKYIDITRFDFSKIQDIPMIFKDKLIEYKKYTDMTDERIEKISNGLQERIDFLVRYREKQINSIKDTISRKTEKLLEDTEIIEEEEDEEL